MMKDSILILLLLTVKLYSCCAEFCNGPKKEIQNGDTFILRGPCPSDNPLLMILSYINVIMKRLVEHTYHYGISVVCQDHHF